MKRIKLSLISLLLIFALLIPSLVACDGNETESTDISSEETTEVPATDGSGSEDDESNTEGDSETEADTDEKTDVVLEGLNADSIQLAHELANGVNAYFKDSDRKNFVIENQNVKLDYALTHYNDQYVTYLQNKNGVNYIENTMDVFVTMENGNTFYASKTGIPTQPNIFRFGYYFYEVRFEKQDFDNGMFKNEDVEDLVLPLNFSGSDVTRPKMNDEGVIETRITSTKDPKIMFNLTGIECSADTYNYLVITMKSSATEAKKCELFINAGGHTSYSYERMTSFFTIPNGDYYTYAIPLHNIKDYTGTLNGIRLDLGGEIATTYYIKDVRMVSGTDGGTPDLSLNRSFYTYSDKLHHMAQVVAHTEVNGITAIGVETKIAADTVAKLIVKDASEEYHTALDTVDWSTAEYIGFDIKDAGIFGYILATDGRGDKLTVTLEDGYYVIRQTRTPENNTIIPSEVGTLNANDFYMGQRIYTDESHDFDAFLYEAFCERNPLKAKANFMVMEEDSEPDVVFKGYDALRGIYTFYLNGAAGFGPSYYNSQNKHYSVSFMLRGEDTDRKIYVMSQTNSGSLECAALLDEHDMMLPIPLEVGKNFNEGETGERNIYTLDDKGYGETIFPLVVKAKTKTYYTIKNLYQNWGKYPLKQISWIQFHAPYYHLSTGVIETNCIMPYYTTKDGRGGMNLLPDHRSWSAPAWGSNDPQHTSGGSHDLVQYTDAEGNYNASENLTNVIDSYGPIYADVTMTQITDDGKIKYTVRHMEMPHDDENRAYYTFEYEVLEDLTVANFKEDFSFYTLTDNMGDYNYDHFGYLNEDNECVIADTNKGSDPVYYVLGSEYPYFDYFEISNFKEDGEVQPGYVNVSFLLYDTEFTLDGKAYEPTFVVKEYDAHAALTLNIDGEFTLKAGDKFTINAIIMPWGSQETDYASDAPDQNVRNVRENTHLDPVVPSAVENCEVIEDTYLPMFKTTNGKNATFNISGGTDRVAVRVYGFNKLTAPTLEKLVDGEWQTVVLNSSETPDKFGNFHYYDGYGVYYDGDGTYSYAFIVEIEDGASATYRLSASEDFKPWPVIDNGASTIDPIDLYIDGNELKTVMQGGNSNWDQFGKIEFGVDEEGGFTYASYYAKYNESTGKFTPEAYSHVYLKGEIPTGQYIVLKYRIPTTNPDALTSIEFYTSTVNESARSNDDAYSTSGLIADGEWHVLVVDVVSRGKSTFAKNENGEYVAKYLRADFINKTCTSTDTHFDVAFIGMCDTIDEIFGIDVELTEIQLSTNSGISIVDKDGNILEGNSSADNGDNSDNTGNEGGNTPSTPDEDSPVTLFYNADDIKKKASGYGHGMGTIETLTDSDGVKYTRINSIDGGSSEGVFYFFDPKTVVPTDTGKYFIMKYRTTSPQSFELFASTEEVGASVNYDDCKSINAAAGFVNNGEWTVVIIDLAASVKTFNATENGEYLTSVLRLDVFFDTTKATETYSVDIAYAGICKNLADIALVENRVNTALYFDGMTLNEIEVGASNVEKMAFYLNAEDVKKKASSMGTGLGTLELLTEDGVDFTRFSSKEGGASEGYFYCFSTDNPQPLGRYAVIKYRTTSPSNFEIYSGTESKSVTNSDCMGFTAEKGYVNSGEWVIAVIDLEASIKNYNFSGNGFGTCAPYFFRLDVFGSTNNTSDIYTVDIAYIGICDALDDISLVEKTLDSALFYDGKTLNTVEISAE